MHPVLMRIYGMPLYSYGLCLALAFFICMLLILKKAESVGLNRNNILDLGLVIIISGIAGARLFYVIMNFKYYVVHPAEIFLLNKGGLVYHGGFILALLAGLFAAKKKRLPIWKIADIVFLYLPLGQSIGRIGCFLNGCCYGKVTDSILGIRFPLQSLVVNEMGGCYTIHPVQIYSSITDILIFILLSIQMGRKKYNGQIVLDYMFFYGVGRFLLEYFRADNPPVFHGLNVQQLVSFAMVVLASILKLIIECRKKTNTNL